MIQPILASAPGKLVLAGEYAVLEPGEPAIVAAVDRRLNARVTPSSEYRFSSQSLGMTNQPVRYEQGTWSVDSGPAPRLHFAKAAVNTTLTYLRERAVAITPFDLSLEGTLESPDGLKYGFGSSAAVTVAIVGALLAAFGVSPDTPLVFKLATIAHHGAQGSGSGLDVASSTYGAAIRYVGFDPAWLKDQLSRPHDVAELVELDWPWLIIETLEWPEGLHLGVGWTGKPASTAHLIKAVQETGAQRRPEYARFLIESRQATGLLASSLREPSPVNAVDAVRRARQAVLLLQSASGVDIETSPLATLANEAEVCGGAGKSSGAGGGDCGVGLFATAAAMTCAQEAWRANGIEVLDVQIAPLGLQLVRL